MPSRGQRAVALLLIAAVFAALLARGGYAAEKSKTVTLGESLSEEQRQELLDYFGADGDDKVITVTVADTQKAMTGIIDIPFQSAYSSTALTCRDLGEGLEVKTRNIQVITPSMYAMALVTAGVGDAELMVAAPDSAPAQGMTALAGMFQTWDKKPCRSGSTSEARKKLALEELALTVDIGEALGTTDGMARASNLVLYTQQAVVINGLESADEIGRAIADQESAQNIVVPAEQRTKLVDLMVRLAAEDIDWSTFSAGWEITPTQDGTGITMVGDGIAIRNAQRTATAKAADARTATAEAKAAKTATAEAQSATATAEAASAQTATAEAQATIDARASQTAAAAAMTSTALAQPTATPTPLPTATPEPTATPAPIAVAGKVTDIGGGQITISPSGGGPAVAYPVSTDASITRGGQASTLADVRKGDTVDVTVDGSTKAVRALSATPPAKSALSGIARLLFLLPVLAVVPVILLVRGRGGFGDPFIVKRVASA